MLKIYDVVLDINTQLQLVNKTTVRIQLLPHLVRFGVLFPKDSMHFRDKYCEARWDSLKYLKEKGVINDFKHNDDLHRWQSTVTVSFILSKFDDFYTTIKSEYAKRKKANQEEKPKEMLTEVGTNIENDKTWPDDFKWEGNRFIFGQYGHIDFTSADRKHIFRALTDKKGLWVGINELKGNKDANYVRTTIKQIKDRLPEKVKERIAIISTQEAETEDKPKTGAYRIKLIL